MIVFLVVHYKNTEEVHLFCDSLKAFEDVTVVITDNSGGLSEHKFPENAVVFSPNSNLGYLNGCAYGYHQWLQQNHEPPEFVCVCNTDIRLVKWYERLTRLINADNDIGCFAPKVLLANGVNQNPNILKRPSSRRINFLCNIHKISLFGAFYIWLSGLKTRLRKQSRTYPETQIYGSHGSCMFFTKSFFERDCQLQYGGFIHDEELHLAEQLRSHDLKTIYDPQIEVFHDQHSALKLVNLQQQSKFHRDSLNWIRSKYFLNDEAAV